MRTKFFYLFGKFVFALCIIGLVVTLSVSATPGFASPITWSDNFDSTSLNSQWSWIREAPTYWNLSSQPGFLRITTQQTFSDVNNLLVQDIPTGDYEVQTRVLFTPTEDYQIAGLIAYQDDSNSLTLGRAFCTPSLNCVGNGIYFDLFENGSFSDNFAMTTTVQGDAYLKLVRQGNTYTGFVSTDGLIWTLVGVHTLTITPTKVRLKASNQINGVTEIPADFDFFLLNDKPHDLFLPMMIR